MVLTQRVKHLERDRIVMCPQCQGRGRFVTAYENAPNGMAATNMPDQSGCPGCGKLQTIVIRFVKEQLDKAWA